MILFSVYSVNKNDYTSILSNIKGYQKDFIDSINYIFDNLNKNIEVLNNHKIDNQSKYNDLAIKCNEFIDYISTQKYFIYGEILLSINNHDVKFNKILFYTRILKHYCDYVANFNNPSVIIRENYKDFINNFDKKNFNDKKEYHGEKTMNLLFSIIKIWNHLFDDDIPCKTYKEHLSIFIKNDTQNHNGKKMQKELDQELVKNFKQYIIEIIKRFFDSECVKQHCIANNMAEYLKKRLESMRSDKIKNANIEGIQKSLLKELSLYYENNCYEISNDELQEHWSLILQSLSNNCKVIALLIENNIENCFNNNISLKYNSKKLKGEVLKNDLDNNILQCNTVIHNRVFNVSTCNYYFHIKSLLPFLKYIDDKNNQSCIINYCSKLIKQFTVLQNIQRHLLGQVTLSNANNILSNEKKYIDKYFKENNNNEISQWFVNFLEKLRVSSTYFDLLEILEKKIQITIEDAFYLLFTVKIELHSSKELFNEILDNMIVYYNPKNYHFKNKLNHNENSHSIDDENDHESSKTMDNIKFPITKKYTNIKNDIINFNNDQIDNNMPTNIPTMWTKILENDNESCKIMDDINAKMIEKYTNIKNDIANFNSDQIHNSMLPIWMKILFLYYNMCLLITFSGTDLMTHNKETRDCIKELNSIAHENFISDLYSKDKTIESLLSNLCEIINILKISIKNRLYDLHTIDSEKLFLNNLYNLFFEPNSKHKNFETFLNIKDSDIYKKITNFEEESSFIYNYIVLLNNIIEIEEIIISNIHDEINEININSEIDKNIRESNNKNIDTNIK